VDVHSAEEPEEADSEEEDGNGGRICECETEDELEPVRKTRDGEKRLRRRESDD
jgi:hypothetical protein